MKDFLTRDRLVRGAVEDKQIYGSANSILRFGKENGGKIARNAVQ
jgi:hypothetical protein